VKTAKQVILGTAGHIDHGKTSLVRALTGIDPDRLKEEKERGITTELGFAFLDLPSGIRLGIVDVPGHEKFVKHMVAGVWGIDFVALVIAADEGVMPQTREHLDICTLLKVKKGLIVLSKIDLIDREFLEMVTEDVTDTVKDTFLKDAPIVPVSATTQEGIPELVRVLEGLAEKVVERPAEGLFRLPIDRVFVMKGFGTVVTGTLVSGSIAVGETVQILPSGLEGKIRNLQVYNRPVEKAVAGQRTAVNLQGLETSSVERGNVLARPHTFTATQLVDAYLEYLPTAGRPLKHRAPLRFHIGTSLAEAAVFLLDRDELAPGEGGFVQLRLSEPVVALAQDRFVIRGSSAIQTIGGGVVLDTHPLKHKRHAPAVIQELEILKNGSDQQLLIQHIVRSGMGGIPRDDLFDRVALPPKDITDLLRSMVERGDVLVIDQERMKVIERGQYQRLTTMLLQQLKDFHQRSPMKSGLAKEELRTKLPMEVDVKLFQMVLNGLIESKEIVLEKDKLRLPEHQISSSDEKGLLGRVEGAILKGALQPPSSRELADAWSEDEEEIRAILEHLVHQGSLVKIKSGLYFHRTPFERLKKDLMAFLAIHKEITTPQFKDMTGASRKYAIPLFEYFDQIKLTLRLGDKRILRAAPGSK
jgi:selenocysteine-specific elongation factor